MFSVLKFQHAINTRIHSTTEEQMAKYHEKNVTAFREKNNATLTAMNFMGFPNRPRTTTKNELSNEQDMSLQWRFYFKSVHVLTT